MRNQLVLPITEITEVAAARRLATGLAHGLGFNETIVGKIALVMTECATNLVKHTTKGGELLVRSIELNGIAGIEIFALDKGPGIANVAEAMQDGYSTAGSSGTGIGAISRLSDFFDIYSAPGMGTAILTRLWATPLPANQETACVPGLLALTRLAAMDATSTPAGDPNWKVSLP